MIFVIYRYTPLGHSKPRELVALRVQERPDGTWMRDKAFSYFDPLSGIIRVGHVNLIEDTILVSR